MSRQSDIGVERRREFQFLGNIVINSLNQLVLVGIWIFNGEIEFIAPFTSVNGIVVAPRLATQEC